MIKLIEKTKEFISDILLPKKCVGCGKEGQYICKDCEVFLSEADSTSSPQAISVWEYEGIIEKAILKIKYEGCYDIINELVEKAFQKIELNLPEDTYITYVPTYKKKEKQRGFNQAELIAKKVGQITKKEIAPLLTKIKDNRSQIGLSQQERIDNIKGAFTLSKLGLIEPQPDFVVLVDDFLVSGATMEECCQVLKKSGIKNVWGFTLARKV